MPLKHRCSDRDKARHKLEGGLWRLHPDTDWMSAVVSSASCRRTGIARHRTGRRLPALAWDDSIRLV